MKLNKKALLWLIIIVVVVLALFVTPAASKQSFIEMIEVWMSDYSEAVDEAGSDEDDDDDEEHQIDSAAMTVTLDDEAIDYAGVETMALQDGLLFPELKAFAKVVDIRDLVSWRSKINQARAGLRVASVSENAALKEFQRLKGLAQKGAGVASKNVVHAEAAWQEARAAVGVEKAHVEDTEIAVKQTWGDVIAAWVLDKETKDFDKLVSHQEVLLQVVLPIQATLPEDVSIIRISREGKREQARKAYYVSPVYAANDPLLQGETYYFKTATGKLRTGMRLDAWVPQGDKPVDGIFIPEQAIVWYAGQPWAYVQEDEQTYKRRPLAAGQTTVGGIFMSNGFKAEEQLVISGAQMLMSEEFRWQIQDEDDD